MFFHFDDFKLGVRAMKASDIIEIDGIDGIDELVEIDHSYSKYLKKP